MKKGKKNLGCELVNRHKRLLQKFAACLFASLQRFIRKIPFNPWGRGGRGERVCELVNERAAPQKNSEFVSKFANSRGKVVNHKIKKFLNPIRGFGAKGGTRAFVGDGGWALKRTGRVCARLFKFLLRLVSSFLNLDAFARSFRQLADAFRSFRRLVLVVFVSSSLDVFAAGQPTAPEIELKLDRIENNISNLTSVVEMLQQQIANLNTSVGGSLSTNVNDFGAAFNSFVDTWKKVVGSTPTANHTLSWSMENMRLNIQQLLNAVRNDIVPALNSISNSLSQVDFEGLTESVYNIEAYCVIIYDEILEIKYILQNMWELQDNWANVQTNQLERLLNQIQGLTEVVDNALGGNGSAFTVQVDGNVDVGSVNLDSSGLWDMNWSFSGMFLKYLDNVAGKDKWDPDFIQSESQTIYGQGSDYRHGVIQGFQNILDLQSEQLEASHRILLCLNPSNDLSDIERDFKDKADTGKQETDRVADEIEALKDEFLDFTWDSRIEEGIENAFSPFLEYVNAPSEGVVFTFPGGSCMGFEWETFQVDCSLVLNLQVAEFIRAWILFFFYGGMIFLVLHVFPWGVARFATVVYYLSNINKNIGG